MTVAAGQTQVPAPDLRNKTEAQAVTELVSADLRPGTKTEAFDPTVPVGLIVSQNPAPGVIVARDRRSTTSCRKGPEPTPTPTPSPDARRPSRRPRRPRSRRRRRPRSRPRPRRPSRPRPRSARRRPRPAPHRAAAVATVRRSRSDQSDQRGSVAPVAAFGGVTGRTGVRRRPAPASGHGGSPRRRPRRSRDARPVGDSPSPDRTGRHGPGRRRGLGGGAAGFPARPDLVAEERGATSVEPAVADLGGDRASEVPAGPAGGRGPAADPAARRLRLGGPTVRTAPHRHGRMVAAMVRAVTPPGRRYLRDGDDRLVGRPSRTRRCATRTAGVAAAAVGRLGDGRLPGRLAVRVGRPLAGHGLDARDAQGERDWRPRAASRPGRRRSRSA